MKENRPHIVNLFQGFSFTEIKTDDFSCLNGFMKHMAEVVCRNDEKKLKYIWCWWASIFQKITVKNGTMPIIYGAQGGGKSFPMETFTALLGTNALMNVDDLDKIFGKFNGLISRHLLILINEPPAADEKFRYLGKIKSKLTQKKTVCETKGVDQVEIDSWANYCITTNNSSPIQEEKGDRRLIYFETDNKYCGNQEYFNALCSPIQENKQGEYNNEFMGILLHYLLTYDISDYDPEKLIREINSNTQVDYNEQLERQYADLNAVERFVVDNSEKFINGYPIELMRIEGYTANGIARKLNTICNVKRVRKTQIKQIALRAVQDRTTKNQIIFIERKAANTRLI
jgi:hypothetical protein